MFQELQKVGTMQMSWEEKKSKIQGGLIGLIRRENSRSNFFLISQAVSGVEEELREISHLQKKETSSTCIESKWNLYTLWQQRFALQSCNSYVERIQTFAIIKQVANLKII